MNTKIAYCSDLHLDFYFKEGSNIKRSLEHNFSRYFKDLDSKNLIIAGDTSHFSPEYEVEVLLTLKDWLSLNDIFICGGNHGGYLVFPEARTKFANGEQLLAFRNDLQQLNGIKVLDGTKYDVAGYTIGGAMGWYDGAYYYNLTGPYAEDIIAYWKRYMNDSRSMNIPDYFTLLKNETTKLKELHGQCDIMVSHFKPVIKDLYFPKEYQGDKSNGFYSFNHEHYLRDDPKLSTWIYGHTHVVENWEVGDIRLKCNPFGYPSESKGKSILHLELP